MNTPPPFRTLLDQAEADTVRLFDVGTLPYCPVCRAQLLTNPDGPVAAMTAVAAHLVDDHDPIYSRLLVGRLMLHRALAEHDDPFYPVGDRW